MIPTRPRTKISYNNRRQRKKHEGDNYITADNIVAFHLHISETESKAELSIYTQVKLNLK